MAQFSKVHQDLGRAIRERLAVYKNQPKKQLAQRPKSLLNPFGERGRIDNDTVATANSLDAADMR